MILSEKSATLGSSPRVGFSRSCIAAAISFQRGQCGERLRRIFPATGRLEYDAGLARIGIDAEDEEFGRQRAKIDHPIDQQFRRIIERDFNFFPVMLAARLGARGYEEEVNRFV